MFNFFKKKVNETVDEPKEKVPTEDEQINKFIEEHPVSNDYKLTYNDIHMIMDYLKHSERVYGIDRIVGYKPGVCYWLRIKLATLLSQKNLNVEVKE